MGKSLFLGDLHLGHKNALAYDNRPFKSIEEHDSLILKNWKETVTDEDDLYLMGDISLYGTGKTIEILKSMPGKLHLLR